MLESSHLTTAARPNVVSEKGAADAFAKLRELTRTGYAPVADADRPDGSLLLRHDSAPDLILHPDGRLDLPTSADGKSDRKATAASAGRKEKRIYWLRSLFVIAMIVIVWFLSVALFAGLLESMD